MNKKNICPFMALSLLLFAEEIVAMESTLDVLRANLDTLARNPNAPVVINLTKSQKAIVLDKNEGKWGFVTNRGTWVDLEDAPWSIVEETAQHAKELVWKHYGQD